MATRKKPTAKKTAKATVKRSVAKKNPQSDFWKVEFTINTVYWIIIGAAVIAAAILTYDTNQRVNETYDQIERINAQLDA